MAAQVKCLSFLWYLYESSPVLDSLDKKKAEDATFSLIKNGTFFPLFFFNELRSV
jgi:hypothetical protein